MEYAIETINLLKRYPTSSRSLDIGFWHAQGRVGSFRAVLDAIRGTRGPFVEALKGVTLRIQPGEIFGILGPNGAGKTTFIKILCTLVLHDGGEVRVNGHDPAREPGEVLRSLQAVLPESRGFNWRLSGRQNLEFYALLYGLPDAEARARIDYLLEFTSLTERANDGIQRYSTGMLRKLLLCRALLRNTPIIVFDEPTADLDPASASEFRGMIIDRLAHEEGKTILLSTHNLDEAQELCDRIAILDRGRVVAIGTPDSIRHLITEDRFVKVVLRDAPKKPRVDGLVRELRETPGVIGVSLEPEEGPVARLTLRVPKDTELSGILKAISASGLTVASLNTEEPTLEEAFMAITGREPEGNGRKRRMGGRISR